MNHYNANENWNKIYLSNVDLSYPAEYVIRIFKGVYPRLNFDKTLYKTAKICDLGCGDGRHIVFLSKLGFNVFGVEITKEIVEKVILNLHTLNIHVPIKIGKNSSIPFDDNFFDYLLSWNAIYYMGSERDFNVNITEISRVLKTDGYLILSIPKKSCFIFNGSETLSQGYKIIKNDPFKIRNGEVLRVFENEEEIKSTFSSHFKNFIFGSIEDDCFGFEYHWHIIVCRKK